MPDPVVTLPSHLRPDAAAHARAPDRRVSGRHEASRERETARKLTWCPPPIRQRVWSEPGAWWRSSSGWRWRARCCSCLRCDRFCRRRVTARRWPWTRRCWGAWPHACRWHGRQCPERCRDTSPSARCHPAVPAAKAGLRPGDVVLHARNLLTGRAVDLSSPPRDGEDAMRRWREAYRLGMRGPLDVSVRHADGATEVAQVERPAAWTLPWTTWLGAVAVHLGPIVEMISIVGAAVVLLLLRPRDASALLIVTTLACAGASTGGSLVGSESALPRFLGAPLTVFSWLAMPRGISTDRHRDPVLPPQIRPARQKPLAACRARPRRHPMIVPAVGSALFLAGADGMAGLAAWDASHPGVFYASFAGGLLLNLAAMVEGVVRYKHNPDANERRRVAVATCTLVLATVAFAIRNGVPAMLAPAGIDVVYPWWVTLFLHVCTALAGSGHHLCGGGPPRPRAACRRAAKPSVRAGAQDARAGRRPSGDAAGRVAGRTAGPQPQRDRLGATALLCGPAGPGHRRAQVPGSRARVAGSTLLPAGVPTRARCCCRCRAASRTRPTPTS